MFSADSPAPDGALSPAETILNSKFVSTTGPVFPRGAPYRLCQAFFKNT